MPSSAEGTEGTRGNLRPLLPSSDELLASAIAAERQADEFKALLDNLQPRTTMEMWEAWSCLDVAARNIRCAAVWMARQEEKSK